MMALPKLDIHDTWVLYQVGLNFLFFVFPVMLYEVLKGRFPGRKHFGTTIMFTWVLLCVYRFNTWGAVRDYVVESGDPHADGYDGTGGNAWIVALGWLPPTVSLSVWFGLKAIGRWLWSRRRSPVGTP